MPKIADLRNRFPNAASNRTDGELLDWFSQKSGVALPELASHFDYKLNDPGFGTALKGSVGSMVQSVGQLAGDYIPGVSNNNALEKYGRNVTQYNPNTVMEGSGSALENIGTNLMERPFNTISQVVGGAVGYMGPGGVAKLGLGAVRAARGIQAVEAASGLGKAAGMTGQAAYYGLPSYGQIRDVQESTGNNSFSDKMTAGLASLAVGGIETFAGPEAALARGFKGIGSAGKNFVTTGLKQGAFEASEEMLQNPIEAYARGEDPLSKTNVDQMLAGGVAGFVGGMPMGMAMHPFMKNARTLASNERLDLMGQPGEFESTDQAAALNAANAFRIPDYVSQQVRVQGMPLQEWIDQQTGVGASSGKSKKDTAAAFSAKLDTPQVVLDANDKPYTTDSVADFFEFQQFGKTSKNKSVKVADTEEKVKAPMTLDGSRSKKMIKSFLDQEFAAENITQEQHADATNILDQSKGNLDKIRTSILGVIAPVEATEDLAPVTAEAETLLNAIDEKKVVIPAAMTGGLRGIARANGIEVKKTDTPDSIIGQLRSMRDTANTQKNAEVGAKQAATTPKTPAKKGSAGEIHLAHTENEVHEGNLTQAEMTLQDQQAALADNAEPEAVQQFAQTAREQLASALTPKQAQALAAVHGVRNEQDTDWEVVPSTTRAAAKGMGVKHSTVDENAKTGMKKLLKRAKDLGISDEAAIRIMGLQGEAAADVNSISTGQAAQAGLTYRGSDTNTPSYRWDEASNVQGDNEELDTTAENYVSEQMNESANTEDVGAPVGEQVQAEIPVDENVIEEDNAPPTEDLSAIDENAAYEVDYDLNKDDMDDAKHVWQQLREAFAAEGVEVPEWKDVSASAFEKFAAATKYHLNHPEGEKSITEMRKAQVEASNAKQATGTNEQAVTGTTKQAEKSDATVNEKSESAVGTKKRGGKTEQTVKRSESFKGRSKQTLTQAFKSWFGNSKIVDKEGNPKIAYHTTTQNIKAFNSKDIPENLRTRMQKIGVSFVTFDQAWVNKFGFADPKEIDMVKANSDYAKAFMTANEGRNIMPLYVRAENPFDYENPNHVRQLTNALLSLDPRRVSEGFWGELENEKVVKFLKENGYDSMYVKEGGVKNLAVFDASQLKSAVGNNGEFSTTDTDVSRSESIGAENPTTAAKAVALVKKLFLSPSRFNSLVSIVDTASDIPERVRIAAGLDENDTTTQGLAWEGKVYLIAGNIEQGEEFSVFMHEMGAHVGLKKLLGEENYAKLAKQINEWASGRDNSMETRVARLAKARMQMAQKSSEERGEEFDEGAQLDELIAYFVEEAINMGINPLAVNEIAASGLRAWFRRFTNALKIGLRKAGLGRFDMLSAQNIVDMAYGAADLELSGTWHGTAAEFRNFNHKYMGTGEGAQAFGWGSYFAQRKGIARDYLESDVKAKTKELITRAGDFLGITEPTWVIYNRDSRVQIVPESRIRMRAGKLYISFKINGATALSVAPLNEFKNARTKEYLYTDSEIADLVDKFNAGTTRTDAELSPKELDLVTDYRKLVDMIEKSLARNTALLNKEPSRELYIKLVSEGNIRLADVKKELADILTVKLKPEGALMRVRPLVSEDELLDWDLPLDEQTDRIQAIIEGMPNSIKEVWERRHDNPTGKQIYEGIREAADEGDSKVWGDTEDTGNSQDSAKAASMFLDSYQIPGIKFLDKPSRPLAKDAKWAKRELGLYEETLAKIKKRYSAGETPSKVDAMQIKSLELNIAELKQKAEAENITRNIVVFNDRNISRTASLRGGKSEKVRFSTRSTASAAQQRVIADAGNWMARISPKLLALNQLVEQFGTKLRSLKIHAELTQKMSFLQSTLTRDAHALLEKWNSFAVNNKVVNGQLMRLMNEASRLGIHPDLAFAHEDNNHLNEKDDLANYNRLKAQYAGLPTEAKTIYQEARKILANNWKLRKEIFADVVASAYDPLIAKARQNGDEKEAVKLEGKKAKEIADHAKSIKEIRGPYFPLMRFGDYVVKAESTALLDARDELENATGERYKELAKQIALMEKDPKSYIVEAFESRRERDERMAELSGMGFNAEARLAQDFHQSQVAVTSGAVDKIRDSLHGQFDAKTANKLGTLLTEMYLSAQPEHSALHRQIRRKGVQGASLDMLRAFAEAVERDSFYLSRMKYQKDITSNLFAMKKEADRAGADAQEVYRNVMNRVGADYKYERTPILSAFAKASAIFHLGVAPSFLLTNMSQPWMITVPQLGGVYGFGKTFTAMRTAWGDAAKIIKAGKGGELLNLKDLDLSKLGTSAEADMIKYLYEHNKLDLTQLSDMGMLADGIDPRLMKAQKAFGWATHHIEMVNRISTALAAYRLEKARNPSASQEALIGKAIHAVDSTQLDYSSENAAYFMKQGVGFGNLNKVIFQFRKYQQGMLYLMFRNAQQAFKGDKQALASFNYMMGMQVAMAGVAGLPIYTLLGLFGGGDDEEGDLETRMRNGLTDMVGADAARVIWKGLPTLLGVDISANVGMGGILKPFPMVSMQDIRDAKTGKEAVSTLLLNGAGAPFGMVASMADGVKLMMDGEWAKGAGKFLPKFLGSPIKAASLATEGLTTRAGNQVMTPDQFDAWDITFKGLGFNPVSVSEHYAAQNAKENVASAMADRKSKILADYAQAKLQNEDTTDAEEAAKAFNEDHPTQKINKSALIKAVASRKKGAKQLDESGVSFTKKEASLKPITRFAGD